jgi:PIN domain nuclease of toxin-antitoxin system
MRILLDTNVVIRMAEEGLQGFSPDTTQLLVNLNNELLFSAVSVTEIAIKRGIGKLDLEPDAFDTTVKDLKLTLVSYTPEHARRMFDLPLHHREPF